MGFGKAGHGDSFTSRLLLGLVESGAMPATRAHIVEFFPKRK